MRSSTRTIPDLSIGGRLLMSNFALACEHELQQQLQKRRRSLPEPRAVGSATMPLPTQTRRLNAVMLRRNFLHVLLALLLLCSQQMRVAHAVSHWGDSHQSSTDSKHLPSDKPCDQCLAFAQIGSALNSHAISFAFLSVDASGQLEQLTQCHFSRPIRTYLSRAPPAAI